VGVTVYRSESVQAEIQAQRSRLDAHRASPDNGLCLVCLKFAPCDEANDAAVFLTERGLFVPQPKPGRLPLLTHVWRLRFGLGRSR
jgi:hypothetical protein